VSLNASNKNDDDFGFKSFHNLTKDKDEFGFVSFHPDPEESESFGKSAARTALQIPSGIAQAKTYPLDILQAAGIGHALDPEEIEHLRKIYEREGIPFDEEKYRDQVQNAAEYFPTQGNAERILEEKTGTPLQAKNKLQKSIKLGATAAKLTPGSLLQKGIAGVGAPVVSQGTQALGAPEGLADILGLGTAAFAGAKTPGELKIGKSKKPSGLTERRFEKLKKPTAVSEKKISKINSKIENEFRDLSNKIIEKSPIEETYSNLKNEKGFKTRSQESFRDVEKLAEQIPEKFSSVDVGKTLVDKVLAKKGLGFTPSEYTQNHHRFIKKFLKDTPKKEISAKDLVAQYRENNRALREVYEPGQSFAYNRAKRQALSDYNEAIASSIEKKFPDSEFSKLFKSSNKRWSEIMDAEAIDTFMNDLFDGKLNFKKGEQFFEKQGMDVPFKRALGEKGFEDFKQLMGDFMDYESASKLMKVAKDQGYGELATSAMGYLIHPKLGHAKTAIYLGKTGYKKLFESLLDKPQLSITWDKGIKAFKKGDFKNAEKNFEILKKEVEKIEMKKD
jgi:hypothetical protein